MKLDQTIANPHDTRSVRFGTVVMDDGKLVFMTQQAYLSGSNESPRYEARAVDVDGNDYLVTWIPYDNYQERMAEDDESACCDWDVFSVAAL